MALNSVGLGFGITAQDSASPIFDKAGGALQRLSGEADKAGLDLEAVAGKVDAMGKALMVAGAAGFAALGYAANAAATFEASITHVTTAVDTAKFSTDAMKQLTEDLGKTFGGDINAEAKALYIAVTNGADTAAKAQSLLSVANKLAVVTGQDLSEVTLSLANAQKLFAAQGVTAAHAADVLTAAMKLGAQPAQMTEELKKLSANALAAGVSFDQLATTLGALHAAGVSDERGVLALKAAFTAIAAPTSDAAAEAAHLGISFNAAALKAKGLPELLKEIGGSSKYTADSIRKLFGTGEDAAVISALMANNGAALSKAMAAMGDVAGSTDKAFAAASATFDFMSQQLKAQLMTALVKLGEVVLPILKQLVGYITSLVDRFSNLPEPVQKGIVLFIAAASAGALLLGALLTVGVAVAAVVANIEVIAAAFGVAVVGAGFLVIALGVLAGIGYAFKRAFDENLGGFRDLVMGVWHDVKLAWDALSELFSQGGFSKAVSDELGKAENQGVRAFVVTIWLWFNRIKNFFTSLVDGFKDGIDKMGPTFERLGAAFHTLGAALGFVQDGPEDAKAKFQSFGETGTKVGAILAKAFDYLVRGITALINVGTWLVEGWKSHQSTIDAVGAAFGRLWDGVKMVIAAFTNATSTGGEHASTWQTIGKVVMAVAAGIVSSITIIIDVFAWMFHAASAGISATMGIFKGLISFFSGVFHVIKALINKDWGLLWYGMKEILFGAIQVMLSAITGFVSQIAAMIDAVASVAGVETGLQKKVEGLKTDALEGLKKTMGLDKGPPAASEGVTGPNQSVTPAGVGAPGAAPMGGIPPMTPGKSVGLGGSGASTAPTKLGTVSVKSETTANINLTVDGNVLATAMKKYQSAEKAKSFEASPWTPE